MEENDMDPRPGEPRMRNEVRTYYGVPLVIDEAVA